MGRSLPRAPLALARLQLSWTRGTCSGLGSATPRTSRPLPHCGGGLIPLQGQRLGGSARASGDTGQGLAQALLETALSCEPPAERFQESPGLPTFPSTSPSCGGRGCAGDLVITRVPSVRAGRQALEHCGSSSEFKLPRETRRGASHNSARRGGARPARGLDITIHSWGVGQGR